MFTKFKEMFGFWIYRGRTSMHLSIFISPALNPYGMRSFGILVNLSFYNVLDRTIYINLFILKGGRGRK